MKNTEILLTEIPKIFEMMQAGLNCKEIAININNIHDLSITAKTIYNHIDYIKNNRLNKKYNNFTLISVMADIKRIVPYSIIEHDLVITTHAVARYFELTHEVLTPDNFKSKLITEESLLYAKRLLRQYWIDDKELVEYSRNKNIDQLKVDYPKFINELHNNIDNEVSMWVTELKTKTLDFFNMKGRI